MKWTDGVWSETTTYATTDTANDAIAQLAVLPEPWFPQVGFNAPTSRSTFPLRSSSTPTVADPSWVRYAAMVEALDAELGRIDALPRVAARTTVVFVSDNGTPGGVVLPPLEGAQGKGSPSREASGSPWWSAAPWCVTPACQGTSWST